MRVTLIRQVVNADDRALDREYELCGIKLALPPLPDTSVMIESRTFRIERYKQFAVSRGCVTPQPLVYLEKDNRTFTGRNFEKQCAGLVELGFTLRSE